MRYPIFVLCMFSSLLLAACADDYQHTQVIHQYSQPSAIIVHHTAPVVVHHTAPVHVIHHTVRTYPSHTRTVTRVVHTTRSH